MGGGAWPFLVGGLICLVNSDNERDFSLLISDANVILLRGGLLVRTQLLRRTRSVFSCRKLEAKTGL